MILGKPRKIPTTAFDHRVDGEVTHKSVKLFFGKANLKRTSLGQIVGGALSPFQALKSFGYSAYSIFMESAKPFISQQPADISSYIFLCNTNSS